MKAAPPVRISSWDRDRDPKPKGLKAFGQVSEVCEPPVSTHRCRTSNHDLLPDQYFLPLVVVKDQQFSAIDQTLKRSRSLIHALRAITPFQKDLLQKRFKR